MWKLLFSVGVISLLSGAGYFVFTKYGHEKITSVRVSTVSTGEITSYINISGRVIGKELEVTYSDAAQISRTYVNEGDIVKRDQKLIEFSSNEAELRLKKLEAIQRMEKEKVNNAKRKLISLRELSHRGGKAGESVEEAQADLNIARLQLEIAESDVNIAKLNLEGMKVNAPISGMVTKVWAQEMQWVKPLEPLLKIANFDTLEIHAKVDAADSPLIKLGQPVEVSSDAYPDKSWDEKVIGIVPVVNVDDADKGTASNTFDIHISLSPDVPHLLFNQQVDLKIQTAFNDSALRIPIGALIMENSNFYTAVVENNMVHIVPVRIGIQGLTHVQIAKGLKPGQQVIITQGRTFKEGEPVLPQQ